MHCYGAIKSAVEITTAAFEKHKKYKEIAGYIKREMDKKHSDTNNKVNTLFWMNLGEFVRYSLSDA